VGEDESEVDEDKEAEEEDTVRVLLLPGGKDAIGCLPLPNISKLAADKNGFRRENGKQGAK